MFLSTTFKNFKPDYSSLIIVHGVKFTYCIIACDLHSIVTMTIFNLPPKCLMMGSSHLHGRGLQGHVYHVLSIIQL